MVVMLTSTSWASTLLAPCLLLCSAAFDFKQVGTVGPPMPHTELRLEAVPEVGAGCNTRHVQHERCGW
jgi:hypothetical protein